jgi:transcriptional regulator with XRE-family HTH domain
MMTVDVMTLDVNMLKRLRARAGLTQQELATRAGLSIALVMSLEQGKRSNPRLDTLRKLAGALGCTLDELASEAPPAEPPPEPPEPPRPRRRPKGK